jgi:hypothetical protein
VISAYDENGCDAMLVSSSAGKVFVCSGQFVWTSYTAPNTGYMAKIDAQPFIVWKFYQDDKKNDFTSSHNYFLIYYLKN